MFLSSKSAVLKQDIEASQHSRILNYECWPVGAPKREVMRAGIPLERSRTIDADLYIVHHDVQTRQ